MAWNSGFELFVQEATVKVWAVDWLPSAPGVELEAHPAKARAATVDALISDFNFIVFLSFGP
jgi:hypothetical protein